ncbi:uncharacterized protein LOC142358406 [Convolutriloba macropyga]|uniref:uncharacterized protein LOC142358406 n=1 Tax=Convolutriloba macropyga TaxID=536237 RepID=UPI003F521476
MQKSTNDSALMRELSAKLAAKKSYSKGGGHRSGRSGVGQGLGLGGGSSGGAGASLDASSLKGETAYEVFKRAIAFLEKVDLPSAPGLFLTHTETHKTEAMLKHLMSDPKPSKDTSPYIVASAAMKSLKATGETLVPNKLTFFMTGAVESNSHVKPFVMRLVVEKLPPHKYQILGRLCLLLSHVVKPPVEGGAGCNSAAIAKLFTPLVFEEPASGQDTDSWKSKAAQGLETILLHHDYFFEKKSGKVAVDRTGSSGPTSRMGAADDGGSAIDLTSGGAAVWRPAVADPAGAERRQQERERAAKEREMQKQAERERQEREREAERSVDAVCTLLLMSRRGHSRV